MAFDVSYEISYRVEFKAVRIHLFSHKKLLDLYLSSRVNPSDGSDV